MTDDPATTPDRDDPGDDTQRRFRYQHGYGVVLLVGATIGRLPYKALWCEHHEDYLAQRDNGYWDSYQIKTGTPENGPWKLTSAQLVKSIGRFVALDAQFPQKFHAHHFVSNVDCLDSEDKAKEGLCPRKFLSAIASASSRSGLSIPFGKVLDSLAKELNHNADHVLATCKRMEITKGPNLDSFEAEIAYNHLATLPACKAMSVFDLSALRDELMQIVFRASSLQVDDPSKHYSCCFNGVDPQLAPKMLRVGDVVGDAINNMPHIFRFAPAGRPLAAGGGSQSGDILVAKLARGGLLQYVDIMRNRALSAERHLLEVLGRDVDNAGSIVNDLHCLVRNVCSDAHALASANSGAWGIEMYREVIRRLQGLEQSSPTQMRGQTHDCLMGIAGLLTQSCEVWWSHPFDVGGAA